MNLRTRTACFYKACAITGLAFVILWLLCSTQASVVDLDYRMPKFIPYSDSLFLKPGPNCLDPHWTSRERARHMIVP